MSRAIPSPPSIAPPTALPVARRDHMGSRVRQLANDDRFIRFIEPLSD
jgi:hypothetical protein